MKLDRFNVEQKQNYSSPNYINFFKYHIECFKNYMAQYPGAVEYKDCISAEGLDSHNEGPGYDTK